MSSGQKSNVTVPHKLYEISVEDKRCGELIESIAPDVIVHLAAQVDVVTSVNNPYQDTQSNILGLVNMLRAAQKAGVSKFIFASSAAVYGPYDQVSLTEDLTCEPVSPYGMNKHLGEYYCSKWMKLYGLNTLCFRFSNVYGPRQGSVGEGGVVSIFMTRLREGMELNVYGDGGQTRDFIYVEDLADAVYRGAVSHVTGVYNLSTNSETSVNQLIGILDGLKKIESLTYLEAREGDIYRSSLDNTRIKKDLDWVPVYSLQEGLTRTFEWFTNSQEEASVNSSKDEFKDIKLKVKKAWPHIKPFAENLLIFSILVILSKIGITEVLGHGSVDFAMLYIVLMGIFYGAKQSVISGLLALALYCYESIISGRDLISMLYDPEMLFISAMYLSFGLIIGFVSDGTRRSREQLSNELRKQKEEYGFLREIYNDTRLVKEELQRQVIHSKDSIGRIHSVIKKLESLEPEQIVTSSVSVLSNLLESDRISVYSVNNNHEYMRLMIKSNVSDFDLPKTLKLSENPHMKRVIDTGGLFVNRDMEPGLPMLVAPILHEGQTVALVSVHSPTFEQLNLRYENVFKVAVDLISGSLSRAFNYVGVTGNERYIDETTVLNATVFHQVLEAKTLAKRQHNTDFVLLGVKNNNESFKSVAGKISALLRESDYIGMMKDHLILLLSNSTIQEAKYVIDRLQSNGIETQIMNEEEVYG